MKQYLEAHSDSSFFVSKGPLVDHLRASLNTTDPSIADEIKSRMIYHRFFAGSQPTWVPSVTPPMDSLEARLSLNTSGGSDLDPPLTEVVSSRIMDKSTAVTTSPDVWTVLEPDQLSIWVDYLNVSEFVEQDTDESKLKPLQEKLLVRIPWYGVRVQLIGAKQRM